MAIIIMLVLYSLTATGQMGDTPVGQTSNYQSPLIVPAGYAFSIWSIIYIGIIAFPVYQWFNHQEGHSCWKQVHLWFAANAIANGVWLVFASYEWYWLSVLIIVFMLVSLYKINDLLREIAKSEDKINFWLEQAVFSIYFGWITLATALNIGAALRYYEWGGLGLSEQVWAMIILPIAGIIAGLVFWKYKDALYAGVVVWAFTALVVRHMNSELMIAYMSGGIALTFILLIVFKSRSSKMALN